MARLSLFVVLVAGVAISINLVAGQRPVYCGENDDCLGKLDCGVGADPPCCSGQLEGYSADQTVYAIRNGTCTCCVDPTSQCTLIMASSGNDETNAQALQQGCAKPSSPLESGAVKKQ